MELEEIKKSWITFHPKPCLTFGGRVSASPISGGGVRIFGQYWEDLIQLKEDFWVDLLNFTCWMFITS